MSLNKGYIRASVRPADQVTLAADHSYELKLDGGKLVPVQMYKPKWLPPTKESEVRFIFALETPNAAGIAAGTHFFLLQNQICVGEGTVLDTASSTMTEHEGRGP